MNCTEFENVVVAIVRDEVIDAAAHREGMATRIAARDAPTGWPAKGC